MTTIDLVYINAGGGHRSAAVALETAIREQYKDWQVRLVNLFEVLDPQDIFRRTTGVKPEDYYNVRLARGWTLGLAQELRILQMLIRLSHKSLVSQLRRHWQATRPDLVVSMVPNFNRAMYQAATLANLQLVNPGSAPFYQKMFALYNGAPGAARATNSLTYGGCGSAAFEQTIGGPCALQFQATPGNANLRPGVRKLSHVRSILVPHQDAEDLIGEGRIQINEGGLASSGAGGVQSP